jgi:hypothetical protein
MTQFFKIVNIDKKEFIEPSKMGHTYNLTNLSEKECGAAAALAVLLASGNGRGGGDLAWTGCEGEKGWIPDISKRKHLRLESTFNAGGKECETVVPKIAGRWAGDRVVVAGDYGDKGAFMPSRPFTSDEIKWLASDRSMPVEEVKKEFKTTSDINLYHITSASKSYKDVTKDVLKAMSFDPAWKSCIKKFRK